MTRVVNWANGWVRSILRLDRAIIAPPPDTRSVPVIPDTPLPKPPTVATHDSIEVLRVQSVDLLLSENGPAHHTDQYDLMERTKDARLVVRRGQAFAVLIHLNRNYSSDKDALSFVFTVTGDLKPSYGHGSMLAVPMVDKNTDTGSDFWKAQLDSTSDKCLRVLITPSADTIVGKWNLEVDTKLIGDGALNYAVEEPFYILFNPWCSQDQVFMKDDSWRQEYVMADSGLIWRGSHNRLRPCPWNFAQFEPDVLDCSLDLLATVGRMGIRTRSDPVKTVRAVSAMVNSPNDDGVLVGNWSGDYKDGKAPTKWGGSLHILQSYYKTKKPVKYGQCWVFSGVVTTVCRALGIPSRSVSNFSSAHDTQNSLTIDYFFDSDGEPMEGLNNDSIWNFHVWNESWMQRPDLEPGDYSGWQVIDATPQEVSDEMYRCGPSSVKAIKRGEVKKSFDGAFVFAEVNADKVFWRYRGPTQPLKLIKKEEETIGINISTKAIGKFEREDITDDYKYKEKSEEERAAMLRALRQCESLFSRYYLNEDFNEISFEFELRDDIVIGSPFSVVLVIKNRGTVDHTVTAIFRVDSVLYTGVRHKNILSQKTEKVVKEGKVEEVRLDVSYEDYANKLIDQSSFKITCLATVLDTNYEYYAQDDFRVRKPDIKIETEGDIIMGQEFNATASFINPLPVPLTKGKFIIEGPGLGAPLKIKMPRAVDKEGEAKISFKLTPKLAGTKTISAKFQSKELEDVDGYTNVEVLPKKEVNGTGNSA